MWLMTTRGRLWHFFPLDSDGLPTRTAHCGAKDDGLGGGRVNADRCARCSRKAGR